MSENTNLLNVPREQIMKNCMKITQGEKDGGGVRGEREREREAGCSRTFCRALDFTVCHCMKVSEVDS